jgi:E3 ubiquitin-protein ligase HUWE1
MNENEAQNSLFIYEPELVAHIAELIHPDRNISVCIQTAVIAALDGLSRYRGKTGEVLAAVSAGVTHGTLMSLLRRTAAHLADPNCASVSAALHNFSNDLLILHSASTTTDFAESLFSFVTFLASSPAGGSMIVGAGIVPILVQFLHNRLPSRLQVSISKVFLRQDHSLICFNR